MPTNSISRVSAFITGLILLWPASPLQSLIIDGGPLVTPPGAGVEVVIGDASLVGGMTITYTGIDFDQTSDLLWGVANNSFVNGKSLDGTGITGPEIFRYDSETPNSITYVGTTTFTTDSPNIGAFSTPSRITYTFNGTGSMVADPDTNALNGPLGDVHVLWLAQTDFSVDIQVEAQAPPWDPNAGGWEPSNELFNRIASSFSTETSFDWGFYWGSNNPPIVITDGPTDVPPGAGSEVVLGEPAVGTGMTISYTGIDLGQTEELYFGVQADTHVNGFSMDGGGVSGSEIFRATSATANSITFEAASPFTTDFPNASVVPTPTRVTYTFTGPGIVIQDSTTASYDGPNGDVRAMWHVQGDFSVDVLVEAIAPPFEPNAGSHEPGRDLFNLIPSSNSTGTSIDWGFYYLVPEPGTGAMLAAGCCALATLGRLRRRHPARNLV